MADFYLFFEFSFPCNKMRVVFIFIFATKSGAQKQMLDQ